MRAAQISANALELLALRQDAITNNLANANTAGYKNDILAVKSFPSVFLKTLGETRGGAFLDDSVLSNQQGPIIDTGNKYNLALRGNGFFVIETEQGDRYTRGGEFTLNQAGQLVTQDGRAVLGENGPIVINGKDASINLSGDVLVDGLKVNKIRIVDFPQPYQLKKQGHNLLAVKSDDVQPQNKPADTEIISGSIEGSTVSVIREMVNMIETSRFFEANQKAILADGDMSRRAVNELGRTR